MYEDNYDWGHPGLDPEWSGHWGDEPDAPEYDVHDDVREDFGWFGEMGLND